MKKAYSGKVITDKKKIEESYRQILLDESKLDPEVPKRLYLTASTREVAEAVAECAADGLPITVSGGRTGIVGGAVPQKAGALLSIEALKSVFGLRYDDEFGCWALHVGAGVTLQELLETLRQKRFPVLGSICGKGSDKGKLTEKAKPPEGELFFPVDPTETTATLGGMAATNASGARTLLYGPMRDWVLGLTAVLADGKVVKLKREPETRAAEEIGTGGGAENNSKTALRSIELPAPVSKTVSFRPVAIPPTKHAAGYYLTEFAEPVDLFIGSEGSLGIITELELKCISPPAKTLYLCIFLPEDTPEETVRRLKNAESFSPAAVEYMDENSLSLLKEFRREQGEASGVPQLPEPARAVLYVEIGFERQEQFLTISSEIQKILEEKGIPAEYTWAGFSHHDLTAMKKFRHALPERINSIIGMRKNSIPELTKIGTDMSVPDHAFPEQLAEYRRVLEGAGLEYCMFGHIGNGHLHVNILPKNLKEQESAWKLYGQFARSVVERGGSVSAEHGIGRLKRKFMHLQFTPEELEEMHAIKAALDPQGLFSPGVLFTEDMKEERK